MWIAMCNQHKMSSRLQNTTAFNLNIHVEYYTVSTSLTFFSRQDICDNNTLSRTYTIINVRKIEATTSSFSASQIIASKVPFSRTAHAYSRKNTIGNRQTSIKIKGKVKIKHHINRLLIISRSKKVTNIESIICKFQI